MAWMDPETLDLVDPSEDGRGRLGPREHKPLRRAGAPLDPRWKVRTIVPAPASRPGHWGRTVASHEAVWPEVLRRLRDGAVHVLAWAVERPLAVETYLLLADGTWARVPDHVTRIWLTDDSHEPKD